MCNIELSLWIGVTLMVDNPSGRRSRTHPVEPVKAGGQSTPPPDFKAKCQTSQSRLAANASAQLGAWGCKGWVWTLAARSSELEVGHEAVSTEQHCGRQLRLSRSTPKHAAFSAHPPPLQSCTRPHDYRAILGCFQHSSRPSK